MKAICESEARRPRYFDRTATPSALVWRQARDLGQTGLALGKRVVEIVKGCIGGEATAGRERHGPAILPLTLDPVIR